MEEKNVNLEPEEEQDVEGHVELNQNLDQVELGEQLNKDDGDDVEAHVNID